MTELIRQMRELAEAIRSNNFLPTVRAKMADLADSMGDILTNVESRVSAVETSNANTVASESSRVTAENSRVSQENSRKSAETSRVSAESSRVSAENTRVSQENSRNSAESARVTEEGKRVTAETARASAETTRGNAESTRNSNENSRKSAETARVSAENTRVSTENTRANNESSRVSAENTRVGNENIRRTNEESRQQTFVDQEARLLQLEGMAYRGIRDVLFDGRAEIRGNSTVLTTNGLNNNQYDCYEIEYGVFASSTNTWRTMPVARTHSTTRHSGCVITFIGTDRTVTGTAWIQVGSDHDAKLSLWCASTSYVTDTTTWLANYNILRVVGIKY